MRCRISLTYEDASCAETIFRSIQPENEEWLACHLRENEIILEICGTLGRVRHIINDVLSCIQSAENILFSLSRKQSI